MNLNLYLELIKPSVGFAPLKQKYLMLSGMGVATVFIAHAIDSLETAPYAAYYVGAVNAAIHPRFWDLLSVISLLLLCVSLLLSYLAQRFSVLLSVAKRTRQLNQALLFLTADFGAIALGILSVLLFKSGDSDYLLAWKALLFNGMGLILIIWLALLNSALWLIGASLYDHEENYSGVIAKLLNTRPAVLLPSYAVILNAIVYLMLSQQ
ncbi:hypothetical protein BROC_00388 [Candidatus Brocadiaceae bacterium]|jgi:hypothetical protein|nr:hypothetical protein BROC_00388 [Candidatus Brocadiaceae bacterium]